MAKTIHEPSVSPHYVFRQENQANVGECTFTYQPNFFSKKEIQSIEDYVKTINFKQSEVGSGHGSVQKQKRNSKTGWISYNLETQWMYDKIFGAACNNIWGLDVTGIHDAIQYTIYPAETETMFYGAHRDLGPGQFWRKVSMTIQLTDPDDFEGGGLQVEDPGGNNEWVDTPHHDRGDMIMFPSFMRHQALPVTKGTRKCLVIWISGPPLK